MYDRQSSSLSHAQKLRQIQGVLTNELLTASDGQNSKTFNPREVARDIGLTNDAFVTSILSQKGTYDQPVVSMSSLLCQFPEVRRKALLGQFASDDSIQMYVYAHFKLWFKDSLIGTFKRGVSSESENCEDGETQAALRMDHAW